MSVRVVGVGELLWKRSMHVSVLLQYGMRLPVSPPKQTHISVQSEWSVPGFRDWSSFLSCHYVHSSSLLYSLSYI